MFNDIIDPPPRVGRMLGREGGGWEEVIPLIEMGKVGIRYKKITGLIK